MWVFSCYIHAMSLGRASAWIPVVLVAGVSLTGCATMSANEGCDEIASRATKVATAMSDLMEARNDAEVEVYVAEVEERLKDTQELDLPSEISGVRDNWVEDASALVSDIERALTDSSRAGRAGILEGSSWAKFSVSTDRILYACEDILN